MPGNDVVDITCFEVASITGCGYNPAMLFRQKPKARQTDKPTMRADRSAQPVGPVEDTRLRTSPAYGHRGSTHPRPPHQPSNLPIYQSTRSTPCQLNLITGFAAWPSSKSMIDPFVERLVRQGVISYGLSSYGYDMRVGDEFRIFTRDWAN